MMTMKIGATKKIMVAKSYQNRKIVSEPFSENGKLYVILDNNKKVRWYSEKEYMKMYPNEKPESVDDRKNILGFIKSFVYLVEAEDEEILKASNARYCCWWGWYVPSDEIIPDELTLIRKLEWAEAKGMIKNAN